MKRRVFEKYFENASWRLLRHGNSHDVWISPTGQREMLPRHPKIDERLAWGLIKKHHLID